MRRIRQFSIAVIAIAVLGVLGVSVWLTFSPPDLLLSATGYAAKITCANVFIAKRDPDAVIGTDVKFVLSHAVKRMRINVDVDKQRVDVAYLGLFGNRHAQLGPGQGFTLPPDTFMMQGHLRQVIAIIPSRKLVILRMGLTREDIGFSNAGLLYAIVAALRKS